MRRCANCRLRRAMRITNLVLLFFGILMIIYSLWLQKKWFQAIKDLSSDASFPKPWFIYTCFGVGIAVCLSTICGHIVSNCISNSILCIYVGSSCCLLFIEFAVTVTILFKIDLVEEITALVGRFYEDFKSFIEYHVKLCRWITSLILIAQVTVVCFTVVQWAIGIESRSHGRISAVTSHTQSFLVPELPVPASSMQACTRCGILHGENSRQSLFSSIKTFLCQQIRKRDGVS